MIANIFRHSQTINYDIRYNSLSKKSEELFIMALNFKSTFESQSESITDRVYERDTLSDIYRAKLSGERRQTHSTPYFF